MGFYDKYILPKMIHSVCNQKQFTYQRKKVVPWAKGRVLEVGIGTGLNLPFYDPDKVEHVWGLDPSESMRDMVKKRALISKFSFAFLNAPGKEIPLEKNDADTILITYTLCTINEVQKTFEEMRRVLKPGGKLIFCEHGRAPDKSIHKWQNRLNPFWRLIGGGCNLNRKIPDIISKGGFKVESLDSMYIPGFKIASFNYWGVAVQR
jgi:ubiquinone/menaquinone biosynthesis C-methylase UbiE